MKILYEFGLERSFMFEIIQFFVLFRVSGTPFQIPGPM